MKFLASLILALLIVIYSSFIYFMMSIVPHWVAPVILVVGLAIFIDVITRVGRK